MKHKITVSELTRLALLFALAVVLSYLESLIPVVIPVAPGIKLGLSNIVTMFCLYSVSPAAAVIIAVLKGGFAFITRGFTAGLLSTCGGLFSVLVLWFSMKSGCSEGMRSVLGAVAHNMAQLFVETVLMKNVAVLAFLPALVLGGIICGSVTAVLLRYLLPVIQRTVLPKNN